MDFKISIWGIGLKMIRFGFLLKQLTESVYRKKKKEKRMLLDPCINVWLFSNMDVRQMILSSTQAWRNCFVASLPCLCNCAIRKNALRTFSGNFKCNLQNTQTAPLAAVCTPTLKLGHRITKKNNVSISLWFSLCVCA